MKRLFSVVMLFCTMVGFAAAQSGNAPMDATKLSLKERWMRVPAELQLTPDQMTQYKALALELHQKIRQEHAKVVEKLKMILTPAQMDGLKQWGEAYRKQREEQTKLTDVQMKQSLDATAKQLKLNAIQTRQFKEVSIRYHRKKAQLFDRFSMKLNAILTDTQKQKFAEMKEDL